MQYTKNEDGSVVVAYTISLSTLTNDGNYSLTLPEASKIVGLYPEQTADYTPIPGDYYIDNGDIADSSVVPSADFSIAYTQV